MALGSNSSVAGSTFSGNVADASAGPGGIGGIAEAGGGTIVTSKVQLSIAKTTVAANAARTNAKGISLGGGLVTSASSPGALTLVGATVAGNEAVGGELNLGGNLFTGTGTKAANTIVSGGVAEAGKENCNGSPVESLGFNIDSRDQCGFHAAGDLVNTDPLLGPLQNNGGPTETMALASNSPAVDKGAAFGLTTDQRGVQRPIDFPGIANSSAPGADGSDVGAFELQPASTVKLGKLKRNKKRGTAKLTVTVPLPDAGTLSLSGKGLKKQTKTIDGSTGTFKFKVVAKGKAKKALRRHGKRKVKIKVTYSPTGNATATATRKAKLIKKH